MKLLGQSTVLSVSSLGGEEAVLLERLPLYHAGHAVLPKSPVGRYSFWKSALLLFVCSLVSAVLAGAAQAQVNQPVVERITVFVVDVVPLGDGNLHQGEDQSVGGRIHSNPHPLHFDTQAKGIVFGFPSEQFDTGFFPGRIAEKLTPFPFGLEVFPGSFFPSKYSCVFVVTKALIEEGFGRQLDHFFHTRVSYDWVLTKQQVFL